MSTKTDSSKDTEPKTPFYQDVDGFIISGRHCPLVFKSALAYKPRPDDLFIVSYPKCGSTWLQNIVASIFACGKPPFASGLEFFTQAPILHFTGPEAAKKMKRPGAIKLHLPFSMAPWSQEAKYIFIARNPKDACVSFYHHTENMPGYHFTGGEFDVFFELFLAGKVEFGDYFDHLVSWHERRNDANVLFITYEQLKKDPNAYVMKIAEFMGTQYKEALEKDKEMFQNVLHYSSFSYMKDNFNENFAEMTKIPKDEILNNPDLPQGLKTILSNDTKSFQGDTSKVNFVRKGVVGDWKNYFSSTQNERLDKKFEERTKGTDIPELWKDIM